MKILVLMATALISLSTGIAVADEPAAPVQAGPPAGVQAGAEPTARARPTGPRKPLTGIDGRVQLLARELDLDEHQQAEVRKILVRQREEVKQAWSNEAVPSEVRIATLRAAGDRTATRIRAILNDSQREKYIKARPAPAGHTQAESSLDSWIGAVGKQ